MKYKSVWHSKVIEVPETVTTIKDKNNNLEVAPDTDLGHLTMALDFLKNLFSSKEEKAKITHISKEEKAKITHIKALLATAMADGKLEDIEKVILASVVKREGFSPEDFEAILRGKKKVELTVPEDEQTKIRYLKDMVTLMVADGDINEREMELCISAGISFGLSVEVIYEVIHEVLKEVVAAGISPGYNPDKLMGSLNKKGNVKKEAGRYYVYNGRCSFALSEEEILSREVEKDDMKHTLYIKAKEMSPLMIMIEIRPCMPDFGAMPFETRNLTVAGFPCLEAKMLNIGVIQMTQHYINCGDFVVQVDNGTEEFLNSFRKEN